MEAARIAANPRYCPTMARAALPGCAAAWPKNPLGHAHVNFLGRYAFTNQPITGLRPLRDPNAPDGGD